MKTLKNVTSQKRIIFLPSGNLKIDPGARVAVNAVQSEELEAFFKSRAGKALVDGKLLLIDSKADIQTQHKTPKPPPDLQAAANKGAAAASANTETRIDPEAENKIKLDGEIKDETAGA